jgi:CheY-like chemotaxis protein
MDGYEVARKLRSTPHGRNAMLVALTGWAQETDRERVRKAGFDVHLVKPVELAALESLLNALDLNRQRNDPPKITRTGESETVTSGN